MAFASVGNLFIPGIGYLLFLAAAWFVYMTARRHKTMYIK